MDTKQLVDKFINGDLTEEQFENEKAKLTPEAQEQLKKDADAAMPDAVEKLKGIRRGIEKVSDTKKPEDESFTAQLKQENLATAKESFFADMGITTDEDKQAFEKEFKSESITVDNIKKEMTKHYAAINSDTFVTLLNEKKKREQEAEEFNANGGNSNNFGGGDETMKKAPKEVKDFINAAAKQGKTFTVEEAEKAIAIARNGGHIG